MAADWRCASERKAGERTSGTQIWIGRRPYARSRSRCARTFVREGLGFEAEAMAISEQVTCNLPWTVRPSQSLWPHCRYLATSPAIAPPARQRRSHRTKAPRAIIDVGLLDLGLRVHHEGTSRDDRLIQWAAGVEKRAHRLVARHSGRLRRRRIRAPRQT